MPNLLLWEARVDMVLRHQRTTMGLVKASQIPAHETQSLRSRLADMVHPHNEGTEHHKEAMEAVGMVAATRTVLQLVVHSKHLVEVVEVEGMEG